MTNHVQHLVVRDIGIPAGLLKQQRHATKNGLAKGLGRQSNGQPSMITHVRPNKKTVFEYDDDGEIVGIIETATAWIVMGTFTEHNWQTEDEMLTAAATAIAGWLEVPIPPIKMNISCEELTHAEVLQMLKDEPEFWGEVIE